MPSQPFDFTETPTSPDKPHAYSMDTPIPGTEWINLNDQRIRISGDAHYPELRGTATKTLVGGRDLRVDARFSGQAISLLLPMEFIPPGPKYGPSIYDGLCARLNDGEWINVLPSDGREALIARDLPNREHHLEIKGDVSDHRCWGLCGIRTWEKTPATVRGRILGDKLLADVRADIAGPVSFSRSIRNARTSRFALLLPEPGTYDITMTALGWQGKTLNVTVAGGETIDVQDVEMEREPHETPAVPELHPDQPLVVVGFAHTNTWGQEPAEWLQRRVDWINGMNPHLVLAPNEVNPTYIAGALKELNCPWLTCSGNHSMEGFLDTCHENQSDVRFGPVGIALSNKEQQDTQQWDDLSRALDDTGPLRIIGAYEPFIPPKLLKKHRVRLVFYGHSLTQDPIWERDGTVFLRKVDSNTFYRVEVGPPHDFAAPIKVERFVIMRDQ